MPLLPKPLAGLRVSRHLIPAHGGTPNTSLQHRPLLIYHGVFDGQVTAAAVEAHVQAVGAAVPHWRYSMYPTDHFHSTSHEVLCVVSGAALCCFGHAQNPARVEAELAAGDVVIVPAGVAHKLVRDFGRFQMVGCYPPGRQWDMCYGDAGESDKVAASIARLDWFTVDPVYGSQGPALEA